MNERESLTSAERLTPLLDFDAGEVRYLSDVELDEWNTKVNAQWCTEHASAGVAIDRRCCPYCLANALRTRMSRPRTTQRVTYRRHFFPNGRKDDGREITVNALRIGSGRKPRRCACCGTEIDTRTPHWMETGSSIDRLHTWCVVEALAAMTEVMP